MASRLDFEPGIDAQRKREEIERAKRNQLQEDKRKSRVANRGYRDAMRRGNYAQAAQFLDQADQWGVSSGAGIKQDGVAEGAISSRFEQTQGQLNSFNGQPQPQGGDAQVGGEQAFDTLDQSGKNSGAWVNTNPQTQQGPVSSAMNLGLRVGAGESFAATEARKREEIFGLSMRPTVQGYIQAQAQANSPNLSERQALFGDMQAASKNGDMLAFEGLQERASALGVNPNQFDAALKRIDPEYQSVGMSLSPQAAPRNYAQEELAKLRGEGKVDGAYERMMAPRNFADQSLSAANNMAPKSPISLLDSLSQGNAAPSGIASLQAPDMTPGSVVPAQSPSVPVSPAAPAPTSLLSALGEDIGRANDMARNLSTLGIMTLGQGAQKAEEGAGALVRGTGSLLEANARTLAGGVNMARDTKAEAISRAKKLVPGRTGDYLREAEEERKRKLKAKR